MANGTEPDPWAEPYVSIYDQSKAAVQAEDWEAAQDVLNDHALSVREAREEGEGPYAPAYVDFWDDMGPIVQEQDEEAAEALFSSHYALVERARKELER